MLHQKLSAPFLSAILLTGSETDPAAGKEAQGRGHGGRDPHPSSCRATGRGATCSP